MYIYTVTWVWEYISFENRKMCVMHEDLEALHSSECTNRAKIKAGVVQLNELGDDGRKSYAARWAGFRRCDGIAMTNIIT